MNPNEPYSAWRQYLREIGQHPLLEATEELELARAMEVGRHAEQLVRSAKDTLPAARRAELEQRIEPAGARVNVWSNRTCAWSCRSRGATRAAGSASRT